MSKILEENKTAEIIPAEAPAEIEAVKPYTFRELSAQDIFPMVKILGKIGVKDFAEAFGGDKVSALMSGDMKNGDAIKSLGIEVVFEMANVVLVNLPKCETDIFEMLASVSNLKAQQIKRLGIADFAEMVIDFFKKEEFKDFIRVVSKFFK